MTSAEMLTRIRTLLDEASASFYQDPEIYSALSDGQREVTNIILSMYKAKVMVNNEEDMPQILRVLFKVQTVSPFSGTSGSLPTDFMYQLSIKADQNTTTESSRKPVYERNIGRERKFLQFNTYLAGNNDDAIYCSFEAGNIKFEVSFANGSYDLDYISEPTEISNIVQPILPDFSHEAIVQYAYSFILGKDQRTAEATQQFSKFLQMITGLYI